MLCFPMLISSLPTANTRLPEHKIGVFVRFWLPEPLFSGISSTKSRFLCVFGLRNPCFRVFRAQNRGFCALLASGTPIFGRFEHKIEVFVRFCPSEPLFSGVLSTKLGFLCSMTWSFEYWESFLPFHGWCHRRIAPCCRQTERPAA